MFKRMYAQYMERLPRKIRHLSVFIYLDLPNCTGLNSAERMWKVETICILIVHFQPYRKICWDWLQMASSQKKNVLPNSCLFCMHDQATVNGFLCLISCSDRKKYDSPKIPALPPN